MDAKERLALLVRAELEFVMAAERDDGDPAERAKARLLARTLTALTMAIVEDDVEALEEVARWARAALRRNPRTEGLELSRPMLVRRLLALARAEMSPAEMASRAALEAWRHRELLGVAALPEDLPTRVLGRLERMRDASRGDPELVVAQVLRAAGMKPRAAANAVAAALSSQKA